MSATPNDIPTESDPIPHIKPLLCERTDFWDLLQAVHEDDLRDGELTSEERGFANLLNHELFAKFQGLEDGPKEVRVGKDPRIHDLENIHVTARATHAATKLPSFLGDTRYQELSAKAKSAKPPRIAVAASGGGYRAMLGTAAFVNFARSHGLYDQIVYFAGLSGSTWALSTALDLKFRQSGIDSWSQEFWTNIVSKRLLTSVGEEGFTDALLKALKTAKSKGRPFTLVDLYGLLFHFKLGAKCIDPEHWTTLNELATILDPAEHPYPIFTCITEETVEWMEMTPHAVGLIKNQYFIPTSTFGMRFADGKSHSGQNEPLYFLQGIWGSAFAFDYEAATAFLGVENHLAKALLWAAIKATRSVRVPQVLNFLQGSSHPTTASSHLPIKDAGAGPVPTSFNLPLPPLIERPEREVDIILVLEMSAECSTASGDGEIRKASQYFNGQRFPAELPNPLTDNQGTCFGSIRLLKPINEGPWIVYIPIRSTPQFNVDERLKTKFFQYDAETVQSYWTLIFQTLGSSLEAIKDIIKDKWNDQYQ